MSVPLFQSLDALLDRVRGAGHILLFCDFDGALAPVFDRASDARLSAEVCQPLIDLATSGRVTVTIVSGRSVDDLRSRACMPELIVAGNHGLDIAGPGWAHTDQAVAEQAPNVSALADALTSAVEGIPGALVENKDLSVSVHFRHADLEQHEAVRSAVHKAIAASSHPFVLTTGRKVYDIRPRVYWNKGDTVRWIAGHVNHPDGLVIFVGGDPTDEDAFVALPVGITIGIGGGSDTAAKYSLDGPDGVRRFLEWLRDQVR